MGDYVAPLNDMRFVMRELARIGDVARLPGYEDASDDLVDAELEEAAKFAGGVLSPLNWSGDRARLKRLDKDGGSVIMAPGFKEAYVQFIEAGWNGLACNPEHARDVERLQSFVFSLPTADHGRH